MHLLVMVLEGDPLPQLDAIERTVVDNEADGLRALSEHSFDFVLIVDRRGEASSAGLLRNIEDICGEDATPVVFAGDPAAPRVCERLATDAFDGFIDLAWSPTAIAANLRSAGQRVQTGRNLVAVQRTVLDAAQVEMETLRLRDELAARNQQLLEAQEQLWQSQKLAAVSSLAARVAHEINNPLSSVLGFAELMHRRVGKQGRPEEAKILESMIQEGRRIAQIVETLTRFGGATTHRHVDLNELLEESLTIAAPRLAEQGIDIESAYTELPTTFVNARELKRAFLHVIDNAELAMPDGGKLRVSTHSIDPRLVTLTFEDTGHGIPPSALDKIFEPFFTTRQSANAKGLGLALVYQVVEAHHGKVEVESTEGEGTKLTFTLPALERRPLSR